MAMTNFGLNDALAVKLWSKTLDVEALKYTDIAPLIGDDANSIIQRKTESAKGPGDKVTYGLRLQLSGDGFTENEVAEGNGEALSLNSDAVVINELGHVVGVKSEYTIDQQRIPFDLRAEARDGLADWYAKRLSVSFFNQVCGNTAETRVKYTGLQATTAPTSGRVIWQNQRGADASLTSSDTFTLNLIDKAVEAARTAVPMIRPINVKAGRKDYNDLAGKYVMYLHENQVTDLRTNTGTGNWLDIQKAAMTGGEVTGNPIYSGALGEYNNVILRRAFDIPNGVNASSGAAIANTRRAVLLGAQSAMIAYGLKNAPNKYRWNEELFDHKRRLEVSAWSIWGLKKTVFNGTDFAAIVVATWAQQHT